MAKVTICKLQSDRKSYCPKGIAIQAFGDILVRSLKWNIFLNLLPTSPRILQLGAGSRLVGCILAFSLYNLIDYMVTHFQISLHNSSRNCLHSSSSALTLLVSPLRTSWLLASLQVLRLCDFTCRFTDLRKSCLAAVFFFPPFLRSCRPSALSPTPPLSSAAAQLCTGVG